MRRGARRLRRAQRRRYTLHAAADRARRRRARRCKQPFMIPFAVGLVGPDGRDIPLQHRAASVRRQPRTRRACSSLTQAEQTLRLRRRPEQPGAVAAARFLGAGERCKHEYTDAELTHLMAHDSDAVQPLGSGPGLATRILLAGVESAARRARDGRFPRRSSRRRPRARRRARAIRPSPPKCLQLPVGELPRREHGGRRSRRDPRGAHASSCARSRRATARASRARSATSRCPAPTRPTRRPPGTARAAQRRARLPDGRSTTRPRARSRSSSSAARRT